MALQWPPVLFLEVTLVIEESEASSCASDVRCAVTEGDLAMMMGMLPGGSGGNQSAADVDDPASRMAVSAVVDSLERRIRRRVQHDSGGCRAIGSTAHGPTTSAARR